MYVVEKKRPTSEEKSCVCSILPPQSHIDANGPPFCFLPTNPQVTDAVVESKKVDDAPAAEKAAPTVEDMQSAVTDEETKKDL